MRHQGYWRYLPNSYYLETIQEFSKLAKDNQNIEVQVFSESDTSENFTEFENQGYKMVLDGSLEEVWRGVMSADVFIMSKSSFSYLPAVLNFHGVIVYHPFWHKPSPGFQMVNRTFQRAAANRLKVLQEKCPS
uniref:Uncharacterized protein n=1 Tax=Pseudictyota dubia TaxID=2749911 RepID=A0A7R9WF20_9STRA|mmetsp:Transcript_47442/g.88093  ORF Transcript_47442/g.88093 Transcript_47442/m.88093 type:complete len:133 (+) Transcript_47442:1-399(+)